MTKKEQGPKILDYVVPRNLDLGGQILMSILDGASISFSYYLLTHLPVDDRIEQFMVTALPFTILVSGAMRWQALTRMRGA